MKIGIMQPYFLPYIGYFQLIDSVDVYVNLDHVSFMKRSYMTRNVIKNNIKINVNLHSASQNKSCREIYVNFENNYIDKFKKTLSQIYSKSINYDLINDEIINPCFINKEITISDFNFNLVRKISEYLLIDTKFIDSSFGLTDKKKGDGLIEITRVLGGDIYINAIGGQDLYQKEYFKDHYIELQFIKMGDIGFDNPYISILDLLYTKPKEEIIKEIKNYKLI
jgi:hypothetical protein